MGAWILGHDPEELLRRPRLLLAVVLSVGYAAFVERSCVAEIGGGPLTLAELRAAADEGELRRIDLAAAPRTGAGNLELSVPDAWVNVARASLEPLVVFVDGKAVGWLPDPPDEEPGGLMSWLASRKRRERVLVLHCPETCREAFVARGGTGLRRAIARARVRREPERLVRPIASIAGFLTLALLLAAAPEAGRRAWAAARARLLPLLDWCERSLARVSSAVPVRLLCWVAPFAVTLLWLPLAVTDVGYYSDWANHLYYTARQAQALRELHRPSYFLHTSLSGPFYPYFAFYGGSLYALAGGLSLLLGSARAGYVAVFGASFACAYLGIRWLGELAGLRGVACQLPALCFVSSAYYLTNAYGRGSWAETAATSALPLMIAAAIAFLRGERAEPRPALAFFCAAALLSGSHTITLVWGTLFLAAAGVGLALILDGAFFPEGRARLVRLLELFTLAVGVNGWFLLPVIAYGGATHIGGYSARGFGSDALFLNTAANLLHPGRVVPPESGTPALYTQLPVYPLAWACCAALAVAQHGGRRRRGLLVACAAFAAYVWLLVAGRQDLPWSLFPRVLKLIQFQFRLHTYINLTLVALLIVGLSHAAAAARRRVWTLGLGAAVAAQLGLAAYQVAHSPRSGQIADLERAGSQAPFSLTEAHDYRFVDHPDAAWLGEPVLGAPVDEILLDPARVRDERLLVELPRDGRYSTNLPWSPLIQATGEIAILGRTGDGWAVIAAHGPTRRGAIEAALTAPVRLGRLASLLSIAGAALALYGVSASGSGSRRPEPRAPRG
jgi:hypothetical protein